MRDPDAGADVGLDAVEIEGLGDRADDPQRERDRSFVLIGAAFLDDRELVAAEARQHVGFTNPRIAGAGRPPSAAASPAAWPSVSLTALNLSRSIIMTVMAPPQRFRRLLASSSFSLNWARLARPVRTSCRARCMISASARRRSVMSSTMESQPPPSIGWRVSNTNRPSESSSIHCGIRRKGDHLRGSRLDRGSAGFSLEHAARHTVDDNGLQRRSHRQQLRRHLVQFGVALVPDDEPLLLVVHGQSLRHVAERGIKPQVGAGEFGRLLEKGFLVADTLGDVFMDRHPSAVRGGGVGDRDDSPVVVAVDDCASSAIEQALPELANIAFDLGLHVADRFAIGDDRADAGASPDEVARQFVQLQIPRVPDQQPAVGVEHAEAGRHGGERGVELGVGLVQLRRMSGKAARRPPDEGAHQDDESRQHRDLDHPANGVGLPRRQQFVDIPGDGNDQRIGMPLFRNW